MSLATDVLEALKKFPVKSKKENYDNDQDDNNEQDGSELPPEQQPSDVSDDNVTLENLEQKLMDTLTDIGLSSVEVSQEDDGDVYADMVFEDTTRLSLQFYVDAEQAKMAMLTADNMEQPPELLLPDSFIGEDGTLNLNDLTELPTVEIKSLVSEVVTVSNTTEVYRRSRATNEACSMKRTKRRVSLKYKNESVKLKRKLASKK